MTWKKYALGILAIILIIIGIEEPMLLIFPMWIIVYLFKSNIQALIKRVPFWFSFLASGVVLGLLTESFAIVENWNLPAEEKILLSPDPILDLIYGLFYYLSVMLIWYLLVKKFRFNLIEVLILTGLYGILAEETGQVFIRIFSVPIFGPIYAIFILFVYGLFPMLTLMINEYKIKNTRSESFIKYPLAAFGLFVQYAAYGLLILPLLKIIFE